MPIEDASVAAEAADADAGAEAAAGLLASFLSQAVNANAAAIANALNFESFCSWCFRLLKVSKRKSGL